MGDRERTWGDARIVVAAAAVAALAFGIRSLGYEAVFPLPGETVLDVGDAGYHARLTLWASVHFPRALLWDSYAAFPEGAVVPWPPLFDWTLGGLARGLGGGADTVDRVLAWVSPVLGALTSLVVVGIGRGLGGAALGLGAGVLYAVFPAAVFAARVGNPDHHAAVGLIAAGLLAASLAALQRAATGRRLVAAACWLTVARLAMLLTWNGSLLYLILADGLLLLAAALTGRRALLALLAASAAASAGLVAPLVLVAPVPMGGLYSAVALSRLHLLLVGALAVVAGAGWALSRGPAEPGRLRRLAHLAAAGVLVAGALALFQPVREGLWAAVDFVALRDTLGPAIVEQRALWPVWPLGDRPTLHAPEYWFGWFGWLIPLAPLAALLAGRDPRHRASAGLLAGWTAVLGALALGHVRYANDFAAPGAIAFALGLAALGRLAAAFLPAALRPRCAVPALAGLLLLWPAVWDVHARGIRAARPGSQFASPYRSLRSFSLELRALTPPTAGYLDPEAAPEYGILTSGNLGHSLRYWAQRPVMLDGSWDYPSPDVFRRATRALNATDEGEALALAGALRARYVLTAASPGMSGEGLVEALQLHDGRARGSWRRLERFRLVSEGPPRGMPIAAAVIGPPPRGTIPYKLFEIVEGAVLEVRGEPGQAVVASVSLRTPLGRRIVYRAEADVGPDGAALLRVPYASEPRTPVRASGPYRVRVGEVEHAVSVPEEAVLQGRTILVP